MSSMGVRLHVISHIERTIVSVPVYVRRRGSVSSLAQKDRHAREINDRRLAPEHRHARSRNIICSELRHDAFSTGSRERFTVRLGLRRKSGPDGRPTPLYCVGP